jgi:hypothetical protein
VVALGELYRVSQPSVSIVAASMRPKKISGADQFPQVQAPQPQPPLDGAGADSLVAPGAAANENRRRTRSLPQFGHASSAWTGEPIGRRSSNGRSQLRQMYSYVAIAPQG